jgi:hypothetical protein
MPHHTEASPQQAPKNRPHAGEAEETVRPTFVCPIFFVCSTFEGAAVISVAQAFRLRVRIFSSYCTSDSSLMLCQ